MIPVSHHIGRINHGTVGNQAGANAKRVDAAELLTGVHYCEAPADSALFFHGNLAHASDANLSGRHRRAYICTYNALSNTPSSGTGHGKPEPIPVVPDDAILRWSEQQ